MWTTDVDRREALRRTALLLGGALSSTTIAGVLAGAGSPVVAHAAGVQPRVLTAEQSELVATVAEHIIPSTDTAGARAAGVHGFIDTMLAECYTAGERQRFLAGLADLDARARSASGATFVRSTPGQQRAVIETLDRDAFPRASSRAAAAGNPATTFFRTFKELTVVGYYTSQIGATRELKYDRVPGRFEGCVPFKTIGRAWSV